MKSMYKPKGHIHPQKNRPEKMVARKITPNTIDGHWARRGNAKNIDTNETIWMYALK